MTKRALVMTRLALRNIRRHVRRSLLTSFAMILGGTLLMISLPLGDGTHEAWIETAVRMGSGHVTIQHPSFHTSRKIADRLAQDVREAAVTALSSRELSEAIRLTTPQIGVNGLASSPSGARPVQIVGVAPRTEAEFSILDEKIVEGRYLTEDDRLAAYVGAGLAERLKLGLDSRLVVTAQDGLGEISGQLLRIVGIYRSGVPEIDETLVHIPLSTASEWLGIGGDVTQLAVLVHESGQVDGTVRQLRDALAHGQLSGAVAVMGWRESMPALDAAVRVDDFGNYLFQAILFSIIGLGIVNTVLMSVLHRYREFGVLQALGLTPKQTGGLVLIEGLVLTAVSGFLGIVLGLLVTWALWRDGLDISGMFNEDWSFSGVVMEPVIVPVFRLARIVQGLVFILFIGALASLYPAYRATRIDVSEAMKFER